MTPGVGGIAEQPEGRLLEPPKSHQWAADHRRGVREAVLLSYALLVGTFVWLIATGEFRWFLIISFVGWVFAAMSWGWSVPTSVDRWRAAVAERASGSADYQIPDDQREDG